MKIISQTILLTLALAALVLTSSVALAEDPQPQAPSTPSDPRITAPLPELDINQAEIKAGVLPDQVDDLASDDNQGSLTPMMTEINAVMETARVQIAELSTRAEAPLDAMAEQAIQLQVAEIKQQIELDILAIQARYARNAGNEELALQLEAAIAAIISPPEPMAPSVERPTPADSPRR